MASVESRIVTMKFENSQFERGAAQSMSTLDRLKAKFDFGKITQGIGNAFRSVGNGFRGIGTAASAAKTGLSNAFLHPIKSVQSLTSSIKTGLTNAITSPIQTIGRIGTAFTRVIPKGGLFRGPQQELSDLQGQANRFSMGTMEGAVTGVSSKFIALSTIAITALSNITNRAINAGTNFLKSFTFSPVLDGLHEYQTNLQAIQTVQANTDRPLPEINNALQQLNAYSDQTIYNFGEMAKNVGTFTAAGVDLKTSVSAIKGIANMAALSGSNSQQAATAMYQLSQALASGKVGLQDWNSVVNAGMGGKKLQNALAQTAIAMGKIDANQVKGTKSGEQLKIMGDSFRESIMAKPGKQSWLTSDILKNSLAALDGRFSAAALSQEKLKDGTLKYKNAAEVANAIDKARAESAKNGVKYTDEQFKALQKLSTSAFKSATEVKTLGQVFDIAKETIGSGWSASFQSIFGNLKEAKVLFTGMSQGLNSLINQNALARNNMLAAWKKGGGRVALIEGLKNAWQAVLNILGPIKDGFRDIFPAKTAGDLISMTKAFANFTKGLIPSKKTMADIRDIAGGVFAVFHIVGQVLGGVVSGFVSLFGAMGAGNGSFLDFAAGIGRAVKDFDAFLKKSGIVKAFFQGLGSVLAIPIKLLGGFAKAIGGLFAGLSPGKAITGGLDAVTTRMAPLASLGDKVSAAFEGLSGVFERIGRFLAPLGQAIADAMSGIGDAIAGAFSTDNVGKTLDAVNTGLLAGIVLLIHNMFSKGVDVDLTGGLFDSVKGSFHGVTQTLGAVTDSLKTMQAQIKANILIKIAAALALLTASIVVLSMIDPKKLATALAGLSAGFLGLSAALKILTSGVSLLGAAKLPFITGSLIALSVALLLLSTSVKMLSDIPFPDLVRGLGAVALLLLMLSKASGPLSRNSGGMLKAGLAMIPLAIGLRIMASAVKAFATMNWQELGRGMAGLAGSLIVIAGAMRLMPRNMVAQSVALVILGTALKTIGGVVRQFAAMDWGTMGKGMVGMAASLVAIGVAMRAMPKGMILQAVALAILGAALKSIGDTIISLSDLSWEQIAKGLVAMGGALLIIAGAMQLMGGPALILTAAGLVMVGIAMKDLGQALEQMGGMSWEEIGKGLVTLAGALLILAGGLYLMAGSVTGAAALLITAAALTIFVPVLATLGAMDWGTILKGLGALALTFVVLGAAGLLLAPIVPAVLGLGVALVLLGAGMALAGAGALMFATAFAIFVASGTAGIRIMQQMIGTILKAIPAAMGAFAQGIVNFVGVIVSNIPKFVNAFQRILTAFLNNIIRNAPKMAQAFLAMLNAGLTVIVNAYPRIVTAGIKLILSFLRGIDNNIGKIVPRAISIVTKYVNAVANHLGPVIQAGVNLVIKFVNGVSNAIDRNSGAMGAAGARLGLSIAMGMVRGLAGAVGQVVGAARNLASNALGAIHGIIKNPPFPSREGMKLGKSLGVGFGEGIVGTTKHVVGRAEGVANSALDALRDSLSKSVDMSTDLNPTITPVLDLTRLQAEASKIGSALKTNPIRATVSYNEARAIAAERGRTEETSASGGDTKARTVVFEQHNHSPKELSTVEIYRKSKNLISMAEGALT